MSKFSELIRQVRQAGKHHTRIVFANATLKKITAARKSWDTLSLRMVRAAKTEMELERTLAVVPDGSKAEKLATCILRNVGVHRAKSRIREIEKQFDVVGNL